MAPHSALKSTRNTIKNKNQAVILCQLKSQKQKPTPLHLMQNISYEPVMLYPSYYIQGWVVCNGR